MPPGNTLTFVMKIDASDLRRLLGTNAPQAQNTTKTQQPTPTPQPQPTTQTQPPTPAKNPDDEDPSAKKTRKKKNESNLLKQLITMEAMGKVFEVVKNNSTIANTYLSTMGKIFGAAIDILLIPFIPVLNVIMIAMTKLLIWLMTDGRGILDFLTKLVDKIMGIFQSKTDKGVSYNPVTKQYEDANGNPNTVNQGGRFPERMKGASPGWGDVLKDIVEQGGPSFNRGNLIHDFFAAFKDTVVDTIKHPSLTDALAGAFAVGIPWSIGAKVLGKVGLGIPGPLGMAWKLGRAGVSTVGTGIGELAGEALGVGAGFSVTGGLALGGIAGLGVGLGTNYLAGKAGIHGAARNILTGAAGGAAAGGVIGATIGAPFFGIGAVPGGLIGAGVGAVVGGGLGFARSLFGGNSGSKQQQQQGGPPEGAKITNTNSNNQTTYNIYASGHADQATLDRAVSAAVKNQNKDMGYTMHGGGAFFG